MVKCIDLNFSYPRNTQCEMSADSKSALSVESSFPLVLAQGLVNYCKKCSESECKNRRDLKRLTYGDREGHTVMVLSVGGFQGYHNTFWPFLFGWTVHFEAQIS